MNSKLEKLQVAYASMPADERSALLDLFRERKGRLKQIVGQGDKNDSDVKTCSETLTDMAFLGSLLGIE